MNLLIMMFRSQLRCHFIAITVDDLPRLLLARFLFYLKFLLCNCKFNLKDARFIGKIIRYLRR